MMIKIKKINKKAQPQVVATVLLILIVIIAIVIIMGFVMPFVKDRISESDCLDIIGGLEISNDLEYTCYDSSVDGMLIQIHRGDVEISGFIIELGGVASKSYTITNEYHDSEVSMYNLNELVVIPGKNEALTYRIGEGDYTEKPSSIIVYPILEDGKTCDATESTADVEACFTPF